MGPAMDQVTGLLETLAQLGVKISIDAGQLRVNAPKGVLTAALRDRLLESKEEILRRLQAAGEASSGPARIAADPAADRIPFPLADLQLGFYLANDPYMELHVRPHYYFEFDPPDLDVAAYEAAWNQALRRHRRELCVVTGGLELQMLESAPTIECRVNDWRDLPSEEAADRLLQVRREPLEVLLVGQHRDVVLDPARQRAQEGERATRLRDQHGQQVEQPLADEQRRDEDGQRTDQQTGPHDLPGHAPRIEDLGRGVDQQREVPGLGHARALSQGLDNAPALRNR